MTTKEAFEKYKRVAKEIEEFEDNSEPLTEVQYGKVIDSLIKKQDDTILEVVYSCGRKTFDNCQKRLTDCGSCVDHSKFKDRQNWKN